MSNKVYTGELLQLSDLMSGDLEEIRKQWYRSYKKECPEIPFKCFNYLNKYIEDICKHDHNTRFLFFYRKKEKIGWIVLHLHKDIEEHQNERKVYIGFVHYMWIDCTVTDDEYKELKDGFIPEGKVYVSFNSKYLRKMFGKNLIYFPWWWMRINALEQTVTHHDQQIVKLANLLDAQNTTIKGMDEKLGPKPGEQKKSNIIRPPFFGD